MPVASADSLTGFGFSPHQAALLGANPNLQNGTGTAQTGASVIKSRNTEVNPQAGNTAFIFPPTAGVMEPYFITNQQSTTALIFVPSGHTIDGSLNGSVSLSSGTNSGIIWQYKPKFWTSIVA